MSEVWTVRRVLSWTTPHFERKNIDAPRLTAELLLGHALRTSRVRLYVDLDRPLQPDELAGFRKLVERRGQGEPTQYLTGEKHFYNHRFQVDARVLVPRPETELLVDAVLTQLPREAASRVLDVCTGSGCIAASLAAARPLAEVWATDLSADACAVATLNAQALGVAERCHILQGDLFAPLPPDAPFDVIVSNPPYIAHGELATLPAEVQREPALALDGGADGLDLLRRVVSGALAFLRPQGLLALEMGETQGDSVRRLLEEAGYAQVRIEKDLERRERMAFAVRA